MRTVQDLTMKIFVPMLVNVSKMFVSVMTNSRGKVANLDVIFQIISIFISEYTINDFS